MPRIESVEINQTSAGNHYMTVERYPDLSFYITDVSLPTLSIGRVDVPTPPGTIKLPGTSIDFADLITTIIIDEQMNNYKKIFYWMLNCVQALSDINSTVANPFNALMSAKKKRAEYLKNNSLTCDISLYILSNKKNPIQVVKFQDCWPNLIGTAIYSTKTPETIVTCDINFSYFDYDFRDP